MDGYMHKSYVESLLEFGRPRELPQCKGWVIIRAIPGSTLQDAMGCYPMFSCADWSKLHADVHSLQGELVSVALVTDPFGDYDRVYLRRCFPDVVIPFKKHYIVDLTRPTDEVVSKHHQYYSRKALEQVRVERCENPAHHLDEWVGLYGHLIQRYRIAGIQAFSRKAFAQQLDVPGLVMFRALSEAETVAAQLWYVQGQVAYSHLAASSQLGYQQMASYALHSCALEYFSGKVPWLNLGGGAGVQSDEEDGLSRFKRGWSTGTRTAFFCGRILDKEKYSELTARHLESHPNYFPAYRAGEFS